MRRRTKARHSPSEPGQDSFLDIVANLVGILIILVMIVGAQAKDAMIQAELPHQIPSTSEKLKNKRMPWRVSLTNFRA